jgi:hypothetical protein
MQNGFGAHASEEALERYAMGSLADTELPSFEEHLLVCSLCQDRLAETESFIRAMREAARNVQAAPASVGEGLVAKLNLPNRVWTPALAILAVVLGLLGWWVLWRESNVPAVAVALQSVRGPEGLAGAHAPSGRPLLVRVDLAGLPESGAYELEVADARGKAVRRSTLRQTSSAAEVTLTRLEPGQYWVRLYLPGPPRELVREFGLRVE